MAEEQKEQEQPTIEEMIQTREKQLAGVDSSILTTQRLMQGGNIKVVDGGEIAEGQDPLTLTVTGGEMVVAMLTPTLNKLLKDRGSISFDLDRFKSIQAQQKKK